MTYVKKAQIKTKFITHNNKFVVNSGFFFYKKDKITKKKLLEMAKKSHIEEFKAKFPNEIPMRAITNIPNIAYHKYSR